jgi:hypothetical protein
MLVATLPESFESVAYHFGMLLGKRSALDGSVGNLCLERDAGGDNRQRLKAGGRNLTPFGAVQRTTHQRLSGAKAFSG